MAKGFVDGDLLGGTAPFDLAAQHLTDLGDDVFITDQARRFGPDKLADDELVVHFRRPRVA